MVEELAIYLYAQAAHIAVGDDMPNIVELGDPEQIKGGVLLGARRCLRAIT